MGLMGTPVAVAVAPAGCPSARPGAPQSLFVCPPECYARHRADRIASGATGGPFGYVFVRKFLAADACYAALSPTTALLIAACAAASLAIGTRGAEHDT
jgi:hypothetical protein